MNGYTRLNFVFCFLISFCQNKLANKIPTLDGWWNYQAFRRFTVGVDRKNRNITKKHRLEKNLNQKDKLGQLYTQENWK